MSVSLQTKRIGNRHSKAPTVVLLHGFMGQSSEWEPLIAPYLLTHDFLLIDLPGHGQTPWQLASHQCGFSFFHQKLNEVLAQDKIAQYCLYGYSLGGRLALYHASHQPAGLKGLFLESCHPGLQSKRQRIRRIYWLQRWQHHFLTLSPQHSLTLWYQQQVFASLSEQQREQQISKRLKTATPKQWSQALQAWSLHRQPNLAKVMREPFVPIQFLVGTQDPNYAKLARKMIRAKWPIAIDLCRHAGHNVHATAPSQWHQHFRHWLNSGLNHD